MVHNCHSCTRSPKVQERAENISSDMPRRQSKLSLFIPCSNMKYTLRHNIRHGLYTIHPKGKSTGLRATVIFSEGPLFHAQPKVIKEAAGWKEDKVKSSHRGWAPEGSTNATTRKEVTHSFNQVRPTKVKNSSRHI